MLLVECWGAFSGFIRHGGGSNTASTTVPSTQPATRRLDSFFSQTHHAMKKLLIKSCDDPLLWYSNRIGELVPCCGEEDSVYWSRDNGGFTNIVKKEDAIVVSLPEQTD